MPRMGPHGGYRPRSEDDPPPLKITNRRMLAWFYRNLAPHWQKVALGVVAMFVGTGAGLFIPLVLKDIFDDVIVGQQIDLLPRLILFFLGLTLLNQVFSAARTTVMHLLGQRFVYSVRMQCYRHLMKLGLDFFERQRSGDVMSRISNDVGAVEHMVVHGTDDIISSSFHIAAATGFLFYLDPVMAIVALSPIPVYVGSIWLFAHYIRPVFKKIRDELGEINTKLQERISGITVVKAFAREEPEIEYFEESSYAYWRANAKSIWMWSTFFPFLSVISSCGIVILVWYGARKAGTAPVGAPTAGAATAAGGVTAGTVVAFLSYMQRFYQPISQLARVQNILNQSLASIARIFELLDEKPSVEDKPDAIELERVEGRVELENVSFKYQTGDVVLRDVSVVAEPGETVALVGRSGAGKTTLVKLVARFHDPLEGRVLVDGHDARDVSQMSLRRHIGMVLQETFLFNESVRENIRYARPDATDEEIVEAARGAHAHEFISKLEKEYDTVIGERGVRLSGGEKQRISIARALLADPRILILDEATSMVDTEAEQMIQEALATLMRGRTAFIIAHRLSTVRNADKIAVIEAGQVVEEGRHEELMAQNGYYQEAVIRQFHGADAEWPEEAEGEPTLAG